MTAPDARISIADVAAVLRGAVSLPFMWTSRLLAKTATLLGGMELIVNCGIAKHYLYGFAVKSPGLPVRWHDSIEEAGSDLVYHLNSAIERAHAEHPQTESTTEKSANI